MIDLFFLHLPGDLHQYQNKTEDNNSKVTNLDYVLDVTIAYPDGGQPLDILDIVAGIRDPCQTHFFYRLYHTSEVRMARRRSRSGGRNRFS